MFAAQHSHGLALHVHTLELGQAMSRQRLWWTGRDAQRANQLRGGRGRGGRGDAADAAC